MSISALTTTPRRLRPTGSVKFAATTAVAELFEISCGVSFAELAECECR
jgi:hypothetical protein